MKALLALLLLTGCAELFTAPNPGAEGRIITVPLYWENKSLTMVAMRLSPPPEYRRWFRKAEQCAGLVGRFDDLQWYTFPAPYNTAIGPVIGFHAEGLIALSAYHAGDSTLVIHEVTHYLVLVNGIRPRIPGGITADSANALMHPRKYFGPCTGD